MSKVYHRSKRDDWGTPWNLIHWLQDKKYMPLIGLDAAASKEISKGPRYISEEQDALRTSWECSRGSCIWLNPPYSKNAEFIARAVTQASNHNYVYTLVPSRTDTIWWVRYVMEYAATVYFIKGRITFQGAEHGAPFPSAIIVFDGRKEKGLQFFGSLEIPSEFRKDA